jgi:hypothetical protein
LPQPTYATKPALNPNEPVEMRCFKKVFLPPDQFS